MKKQDIHLKSCAKNFDQPMREIIWNCIYFASLQ